MKNRIVIAVVVALLLIAAALYSTFSSGVPVQVARVERGEIQEFIDERGTTRLEQTYLITMPFAGRIREIDLREGDAVTAGQIVAGIAPGDLADEVAEARSAVERLDAALAENDDTTVEASGREQAQRFLDSMIATVAAANARIIAGKRRVEYAKTYLGDVRTLQKTGSRTKDDLDRASLAYVESQVDYQQDVLVWEAMKSIKAATALLPKMVTDYIARKNLTHNVLEKQKLEAQARLRQAMTRQKRGTMNSPVDGIVLNRPIRDEQFLAAGTRLLEIGQLSKLQVEAEVLSQDVVRVEPGQSVEIYGPAIGGAVGRGVPGVVDRVYPAGFTKISSLGVEQQRVNVVVRFGDDILTELKRQRVLGVDFRVRVRIVTREKADALVAPRSALFRGPQSNWQLFVVRGGRAVLQDVEVGLINDRYAEIESGVEEGEPIVLAPETNLVDGSRVKATNR